MAKKSDMFGNKVNVVDDAVTISIERFQELIIKEAKYDELRSTNAESEEE